MKLLIVDDVADTTDSLCLALLAMGHEVTAAYTAEEALALVCRLAPFDGYVFDWELAPGPGGTGADLLERLRAAGDATPCVMVTAHGLEQFEACRLRVAGLGPVRCLRKPFHPGEVVGVLEAMRPREEAPCSPQT